ncbi:unnamed protein product, partial [Polarella glacialis]
AYARQISNASSSAQETEVLDTPEMQPRASTGVQPVAAMLFESDEQKWLARKSNRKLTIGKVNCGKFSTTHGAAASCEAAAPEQVRISSNRVLSF